MIRDKLKMSRKEMYWQRSWINIQMMLADQPQLVKKTATLTSGKEAANVWRNRKPKAPKGDLKT